MILTSLVSLLWACSTADPSWEVSWSPVGTDLHAHTSLGSNDTPGESWPADYARVAAERDLALVVLTDHSNSAGSMDCGTGDVEDCPNQGSEVPAVIQAEAATTDDVSLLVGMELSPVDSLDSPDVPTGHTGCLPPFPGALDSVEAVFTDRPVGTVPGGDGVRWCQEQGGFAVVNHPYAIAGWIEYDWTELGYDGLEVYNGRFDLGDVQSVQAWLCDLSQDRDVVAVGGSDTHDVDAVAPPVSPLEQALGWPTTWVLADDGDVTSLLDGLTGGHTVISEPGTELMLLARTPDGADAVGPGETLETGGAVELRVRASTDQAGLELLLIAPGSCEDQRTEDGTFTLNWEELGAWSIGTAAIDETVVLEDPPARVLALLWPRDTDDDWLFPGVALTAPIHLE